MTSWLTVEEIAGSVRSGNVKAANLVEQSLKIIAEKSEFQAILSVTAERARDRAKQIDERASNGKENGRLAGVPFIAKDNFLAFGAETTAASNILKGFDAPYQATVIEKLEAEGAICVAKANLDAFGHGASTENSDFMITKNPHDLSRVPGGSSGGSAAAVVLQMAPFAIGTDTGGSIRQPASLSGCVGYKPTYGLVSRSGVIAMASSTDTIGPLTNSVKDAALVLDCIAGKDELDSTTIDREDSYVDLEIDIKGKSVGVIKQYMGEGIDDGVRQIIVDVVDKLKKNGANIREVSLPSLPLALACYYIVMPAEVSSNLSRYDGQRYGYSELDAANLDESYKKSRSKGFGSEAKRRIMIGTYVLSSGYYDAYYKKAQQLRSKLIDEFSSTFAEVDYLLGPTAPTVAFPIGKNTTDPLQMYLCDIMTVAANLVGVPSVVLPAGMSNNLPVGLQLMAQQRKDHDLLSLANYIEEMLK